MGDLHRLIAFDLDGTLVDSRRDLAESIDTLLGELGGLALGEEAIGQMVGEGAATLVGRALIASGLPHADVGAVLPRFLEIYDARLLRHTRAYDGIAEAVSHARAHAHVVVLTNKPSGPSERILSGLALRDLFDEIIGGDGPWPRKPDPASLRAAMARFGATPARTLLVGDSAIDQETARRAPARCCLAAYGFSFHTVERDRVTPDAWIVQSPADIVAVIDRFTAGG